LEGYMPARELTEAARDVADAFAPGLLVGEGRTLVIIVCDEDGWSYALRGSLPHAVKALEAAVEDARRGEGFAPFSPPVA
jgi:hypothetical protein